jgi:hypothetical protein
MLPKSETCMSETMEFESELNGVSTAIVASARKIIIAAKLAAQMAQPA